MANPHNYCRIYVFAFGFLTSVITLAHCSTFLSTTFGRQECSGESCGWQQVVKDQRTMGLTPCAIQCCGDTSCIGFSTETIVTSSQNDESPAGCYIHRACIDSPNPQDCSSQTTTQHEIYAKLTDSTKTAGVAYRSLNTTTTLPLEVSTIDPETGTVGANSCQNNGTWDEKEERCSCHGDWVDVFCHRYAYNCLELTKYGYPRGLNPVMIHPNTSDAPFLAICGFTKTIARTHIFMNRGLESLGLNRSWENFEQGFYIDRQNSWLGLAHINAISRTGHTDVVFSVTLESSKQNMHYFDVHFGDASTNYTLLNVGKSRQSNSNGEGVIGNCLGRSIGAAFSTFDSETCDCPSPGCTGKAGAAWWFVGCDVQCNPLARKYENPPQKHAADRINVPGYNLYDSSYAEKFVSVTFAFMEYI